MVTQNESKMLNHEPFVLSSNLSFNDTYAMCPSGILFIFTLYLGLVQGIVDNISHL